MSIRSPEASTCFLLRYMFATASVQKGTRSAPGTSFAMEEGNNSQCQPSKRNNATATIKSKMSSSGDSAPSAKKGKTPSCTASARTARTIAARKRERGEFRNESSGIATRQ